MGRYIGLGVAAVLFALVLGLPGSGLASAAGQPLIASDFIKVAPRGFGDRYNNWAQSMTWWRGSLYVGTARATYCETTLSIWVAGVNLLGPTFGTAFPYPPLNQGGLFPCPTDKYAIPVQAEIWRYTPAANSGWQRVLQSPADLPNPGVQNVLPPAPAGEPLLPEDVSFRGLTPFVEPDGTEALYAFGVNSTGIWDRTKLPPPRIWRSLDGLAWTRIPQDKGTFLGDLPFDPDHSSFRSAVGFKGKLFTLAGQLEGNGVLIGSADPAKGNNAWSLMAPANLRFFEIAAFNGWLYLGGHDTTNGYTVWKTRGDGSAPIEIIAPGAYLTSSPSPSVVSMFPFQGRLYVGTATMAELIRINPDDTWDLVVGTPRQVTTSGGTQMKYPLSGLDVGFDNSLNDHIWRMQDHDGRLYLGTYNAATSLMNDPTFLQQLKHIMGLHLYQTPDGWYYTPVTTNGFADPNDPHGGMFDYGARTMASTPFGLFVGTTNDAWGLQIFQATKPEPDNRLTPPGRVEVEPSKSGAAVLSWEALARANGYQVWRSQIGTVRGRQVYTVESFIPPDFGNKNKLTDIYTLPYQLVGTTCGTAFVDATVDPTQRYVYYVVTQGTPTSAVSTPSNLVRFPLLAPTTTFDFDGLLSEVALLDSRQRFNPGQAQVARQAVVEAKNFYTAGDFAGAIARLQTVRLAALSGTLVLAPEATDVEVLLEKEIRHLALGSPPTPPNGQPASSCIATSTPTQTPAVVPSGGNGGTTGGSNGGGGTGSKQPPAANIPAAGGSGGGGGGATFSPPSPPAVIQPVAPTPTPTVSVAGVQVAANVPVPAPLETPEVAGIVVPGPQLIVESNGTLIVPGILSGLGNTFQLLPVPVSDSCGVPLLGPGTFQFGAHMFLLTVRDANGADLLELPSAATLVLVPTDDDLATVEGDWALLALSMYDPISGQWEVVPSTLTPDGLVSADIQQLVPAPADLLNAELAPVGCPPPADPTPIPADPVPLPAHPVPFPIVPKGGGK